MSFLLLFFLRQIMNSSFLNILLVFRKNSDWYMLFFVFDNKKRDFLCTKNMHKKSRFNVYIGYPIPGLLRRTDENRHMHSMKLLPF